MMIIDRFFKKIFKNEKYDLQKNFLYALKSGIKFSETIVFDDFKEIIKFIAKSSYSPSRLKTDDLRLLFSRKELIETRKKTEELIPLWEENIEFITKNRDKKKPLLAIIIPDGQSVRTFIFTDVWKYLNSWADVVIIGMENIKSLCRFISIEEKKILPMLDIKRMHLDTLLRFSHYRNSKSITHKIFRENIEKSLITDSERENKIKRIWELSAFFSTEKDYIKLYEFMMFCDGAIYPLSKLCEVIRKLKPDMIVNTHAISHNSRIWTKAAALEGIPSAAFVISWDNLSSKWHIDEFANLYLLWSKEMTEDFKNTFPIFSSKNIVITGSPQFEPIIRKSFGVSKKEFFAKYNLKHNIPLILYTTGSKTTFPAEPECLYEILRIWRNNYHNRMQFMIRMHPKDVIERYKSVMTDFPEVPFTLAGENLSRGEKWLPTIDDLGLLVDQINYCDVIVNVASTMTIEGFAVDKPAVNIGFDLGKINAIHYPLKDYYNSKHYSDIVKSGSAKLAMNYEEVFKYILYYLENPFSDRISRQEVLLKKCLYPFDSSERINNALKEFLKGYSNAK